MQYYHCSPTAGLRILTPRKPLFSEKPERVYMTTLLPMALMYGIKNYEYTYGYTREGQIYVDEYFPNALQCLYGGKSATLYLCDPKETEPTKIPNEAVSREPVSIVEQRSIPDLYEALLEQERLGTLVIRRYDQLSPKMLEWIKKVEADSIRQYGLPESSGAMADYYRTHYPESWELAKNEP